MMLKYAVIGLGRFGATLARELSRYGAEVIAIDREEGPVEEVRDHVSVALRMDGTDEKALKEQGVDQVDVAVVGMTENFEGAQLATVVLRRLGVPKVVVKAATPLSEAVLKRIGADEVVSPERTAAVRLAQKLLVPRIVDCIELSEGHSLVQVRPPKRFHGKTIRELDVRRAYRVNIVAVKKRVETGLDEAGEPVYEERLVDIPRPDDVVEADDVLVVIGEDEDINRMVG